MRCPRPCASEARDGIWVFQDRAATRYAFEHKRTRLKGERFVRGTRLSLPILTDFVEPPWGAPVDVEATLRAIPPSATVAGMFLAPLAEEARKRGRTLPSARERYIPFRFYPVSEHVRLLLEGAEYLFGGKPLRVALRKLGRAAPQAMLASTLGRVTLGTAEGVRDVLTAMVRTYPLNLKPCRVEILSSDSNSVVLRLADVCFFLDCHHVGIFEGAMHFAGVHGQVRVRTRSPFEADFLCTW